MTQIIRATSGGLVPTLFIIAMNKETSPLLIKKNNVEKASTLTINELEQALDQNEKELEKALLNNSLELASRLSTQRAILKDCLIEALTENLNRLKQAA